MVTQYNGYSPNSPKWGGFTLNNTAPPYNPNQTSDWMTPQQYNPAPVSPMTDMEFNTLVGANNTTASPNSFMNTSFGNSGGTTDSIFSDTLNTDYNGVSGTGYNTDPTLINPTTTAAGGNWWDSFAGTTFKDGSSTTGWGAPVAGIAIGAMNAYLGLQKLNLAKDTLKFQKDSFSKQFENQRTLTNAQLRDRQIARDSATGRSTVGSYMKQNGV